MWRVLLKRESEGGKEQRSKPKREEKTDTGKRQYTWQTDSQWQLRTPYNTLANQYFSTTTTTTTKTSPTPSVKYCSHYYPTSGFFSSSFVLGGKRNNEITFFFLSSKNEIEINRISKIHNDELKKIKRKERLVRWLAVRMMRAGFSWGGGELRRQ